MKDKKRKKSKTFDLATSFEQQVVNGANYSVPRLVHDATRRAPSILKAKHVQDRDNPKAWYIKYTNITPATNENRPMEPIFNTSFNNNGTQGVPKFVDVDVEWTGYADTFMMNQVAYNAMQALRHVLKSNLVETQDDVKSCLVNGIALATIGKMLERDVHWNLYDAGNDFNFVKMYQLRATSVSGEGIVSLYPTDYLLDENLPYTNSIYNKIVSIYNSVLKVPSRIGEFISHYFGSLFTLGNDGKNDQYLRLQMHNMDFYDEDNSLTKIDAFNVDLDTYIDLLDAYSKRFSIVISDLDKALSINRIGIQKYESYNYSFIHDRALIQALINAYTDSEAVKNGFIRMDRLEDVDDDLTQFLFMGAVQPEDNSKSNVKAIRVLDMILKVNSDETLEWPSSFLTVAVDPMDNPDDPYVRITKPFGISLVTSISRHTDVVSLYNTTAGDVYLPLTSSNSNAFTALLQAGFVVRFRAGAFPANSNGVALPIDTTNHWAGSFAYLGCIGYKNGTSYIENFFFLKSSLDATQPGDHLEALASHLVVFSTTSGNESASNSRREFHNHLLNIADPSFFFISSTSNSALNVAFRGRLADEMSSWSRGQYSIATSTPEAIDVSSIFSTLKIGLMVRRNRVASFIVGEDVNLLNVYGSWSHTATNAFTPAPHSAVPNALISMYQVYVSATVTTANQQNSVNVEPKSYVEYACAVIDYHIPILVKSTIRLFCGEQDDPYTVEAGSDYALIKEDYIPYYYNILDLIPVLYEMFVSLFSIDQKVRNSFNRDGRDRK